MKKLIMILISLLLLTACSPKPVAEDPLPNEEGSVSFMERLEDAKGTQVRFYGWGGSDSINGWLDTTVSSQLKENYEVELIRIPMNPDQYLAKLMTEKSMGSEGTIDVIWINGENFYNAKTKGLLYGPFVEMIPNFTSYVKPTKDVTYDFGFPVKGYSAPYGRAQLVFIGDTAKTQEFPRNHIEFMEFAKANKGRITYPEVTDFTGSAFVRNIIYDVVGHEIFIGMEADKEIVREAIMPAIEFLKEIKPYLWREGQTYPANIGQLVNMFADGEVLMTMSYTPLHAASKIAQGIYPETAQTFLFDYGTIANTHFLAIPFNAPNKNGALALINYLMSPEMQASKLNPIVWGDQPVVHYDLLSEEQRKLFDDIEIGVGVLSSEVLAAHSLPEMRSNLVPLIEEIWREEILGE
ncbi:MAG: ABC transporter substrate-binding protein [Alkaliphilus sp.]|nr:MAG: ABC transporter substrate-binding protein [Alkaliphilus sp.]